MSANKLVSESSFEADAVATADALSSRSDSIDSTESSDPSLSYRRSLFQHTTTQYLRAKDRLAKQTLRKSRAGATGNTANLGKSDSLESNESA